MHNKFLSFYCNGCGTCNDGALILPSIPTAKFGSILHEEAQSSADELMRYGFIRLFWPMYCLSFAMPISDKMQGVWQGPFSKSEVPKAEEGIHLGDGKDKREHTSLPTLSSPTIFG